MATFWEREKTRVSCVECRGIMVASSLCHYMERSHGVVLPQTRRVDVGGVGLDTYVVSYPRIIKSV